MKTISTILAERAHNQPDTIAFTFLTDGFSEEQNLTYGQLHQQASNLGAFLEQNFTTQRPVLLLFPQGLAFISTFFSCLAHRFIAVPVALPTKNRGIDKIRHIVEDAGIEVVLTTRDVYQNIQKWFGDTDQLPALTWVIVDGDSLSLEAGKGKPLATLPAQQPVESLAFIQYTSGSTGQPKGVMVTHENILANSQIIRTGFGNTEKSLSVCWLPSFHDMGLIDGVIQPIFTGFRAVLMAPMHFLQRPVRWLQAISRYGATYSGGPNFAFDYCVNRIKDDELQDLDLSRLSCLYNGAEPIRAETMAAFVERFSPLGFKKEKLFTCYGLAEATLAVTTSQVGEFPTLQRIDPKALELGRMTPSTAETSLAAVSCGVPRHDTGLSIRNPETGLVCRDDETGEVWVSGKSITAGYWNQEELSAYTFPTVEGQRWLRTGDLGTLFGGELYITGRLKDLIIIRGSNHYPQDIERTVERSHDALQPHAGVAFSVSSDGSEKLVIVQELSRVALAGADREGIFDAILQQVSQRHELFPQEIILTPPNSVPKTTSGKLQRRACRALYLQDQLNIVGRWKHRVA